MALAVISLNQVSVRYGFIRAIDKINLQLEHGNSLALVGPNGAGKTTLLKVIAGLVTPTSGTVKYNDMVMNTRTLDNIRQRITMVFQKPILFGTTVFKNVAYGLRLRGIPESEIKRRVKKSLEMVQMESSAERQARTLSGGEQKRVSIAMSIAIDPDVLLLDEPTAYLDHTGTTVIEDLIKQVQKERNVIVVIATHDLFQVIRLAKKVAFLEQGRIKKVGRSTTLVREELESIVFSDKACNTFTGTIEESIGIKERHLTKVRIGTIEIEAIAEKSGEVMIRIPPEDIVVSLEPVLSSARNMLQGHVKEIEKGDSIVRVVVDIGINLTAIITESSLRRLKVKKGDTVYVTFKASSVRVY